MKSQKFRYPALLLSAVSLGISFFSFMPSANAIDYNGVRKVTTGKHQGILQSIFVQPDPAFSGSVPGGALGAFGPFVANIPSYSSTGNQQVSPGNLTGVNLPALGAGLLPSTGIYQQLSYCYSIPGSGGNADQNLTFIVQTEDGLLHSSNFAVTGTSGPFSDLGVNNGRQRRRVLVQDRNSFTPAIAAFGTGSFIRKVAVVFQGSNAQNSVNLVLPPRFQGGTGLIFLGGTVGNLGDFGSSLAPFTALATSPDTKFNFEF